jgi:hypothetical protein
VTIDVVLEWMIEFIDTLHTQFVITINYNAIAISTRYNSQGHAKASHSSLVVSWQRIDNSFTVTAAHYEVFFSQTSSFLAIYSQLFCQLPTPETLSILFLSCFRSLFYSLGAVPHRKHRFHCCCVWIRCCRDTFTGERRGPQETPLYYCLGHFLPRECVYRAVAYPVNYSGFQASRHNVIIVIISFRGSSEAQQPPEGVYADSIETHYCLKVMSDMKISPHEILVINPEFTFCN